ncbi:MAG: hypothetical protein LKH07_05040 [Acetobacter peroxydans]|jgi:hypothetical protein|nr:hypothetical protein [Acetobacter peroxydans]
MTGNSSIQVQFSAYTLEFGKKNLRKNLQIAGQEVAATARRNIRNATGTGRLYYGPGGSIGYRGGRSSGQYTASAPGQAPVSVTGALARSIRARLLKGRYRDVESIRDTEFYAKFLEAGASGGRPGQRNQRARGKTYVSGKRVLKPRPFLSTALAQRAPDIRRRLADAAIRDVVMEKVKP